MSEEGLEINNGKLEDFTIDQFAGAAALIISSIGALLTIIWQSRCLCRVRIGFTDKCYIFDCERAPPKDDEDKSKKDKKKDTAKAEKQKEDEPNQSQSLDQTESSESILPPTASKDTNITATITEP